MPKEFICSRCGRTLLTRDEDDEEANRAARARFGCDPNSQPERFERVCQDCFPLDALVITPRQVPKTRCPGCGIETEEVEELTASPNGPRPGGFIVCPRCASISVYNARMELRPVERSDLNMLMEINPEGFMLLLAATMAAREWIRERARNN
jgi:hypothetical protein